MLYLILSSMVLSKVSLKDLIDVSQAEILWASKSFFASISLFE